MYKLLKYIDLNHVNDVPKLGEKSIEVTALTGFMLQCIHCFKLFDLKLCVRLRHVTTMLGEISRGRTR